MRIKENLQSYANTRMSRISISFPDMENKMNSKFI